MKCPNCGQVSRNDREVCALCGAVLKPRRRSLGRVLLTLAVLMGLLVAGGAIYLLLQPAPMPEPQRFDLTPEETAPAAPDGPEEPAPLFEDGAEIFALDRCTLVLRRDGTVAVAGQSASPEFGFDLFDWSGIVQLLPQDAWIAGLTADGRVRLTGEVADFAAAARWTGVVRLVYDAGSLLGLTADGRVLAAGPDLSFDASGLTGIVDLIPCGCDTLAVDGEGTAHVLPHLGMLWDADGLPGVAQAAVGADYALLRMADGTVRGTENYSDFLEENGWADPLADWQGVKELILGDLCILGLTEDGRVLSVPCVPGEPAPDTGAWTGVVQLLYDPLRNRAIGLTAEGRVLQASPAGEDRVLAGWEQVVLLRRNDNCTVGLTADGRVLVRTDDGSAPFDAASWTGVTQIALSGGHLVGLTAEGKVLAVGDNSFGQCG